MGKQIQHESYGKGKHTIVDNAFTIEDDLVVELEETFGSPNYQPPLLPRAATELLALSRDPGVSMERVHDLLETDALLAARVLKIAQSPFYAGSAKLTSLKNAIVRIGLNTLRDVVMEAAMNMKVFRSQTHQSTMNALQTHSRVTAHLCRVVCRYTSIDGEFAFLCGLLHDVGIAGALLLSAEGKIGEGVAPDVLWSAVQKKHALGSQRMCELWGLPPDIQWAVGFHHQIEQDGFVHPMAAVICIAEHFANKAGAKLHDSIDPHSDALFAKACQGLDIDNAKLEQIEKAAVAALEDVLG